MLIFVCYVFLVSGYFARTHASSKIMIKRNPFLNPELLDTVRAVSSVDCARLCSTMSRCSGYKYHVTNRTCQRMRSISDTQPGDYNAKFRFTTFQKPAELLDVMLCMNPPYIEGSSVVTGRDTAGVITATYTCMKTHVQIGGSVLVSTCNSGSWSDVDLKCTDYSDCTQLVNGRAVYGGTLDRTESGRLCQRWDSDYPHGHDYNSESNYTETNGVAPETLDDAANFCRDPGNPFKVLWCYTTDAFVRWERCAVPIC